LLTLSNSHSFRFCPRPPKSHTLENNWPSFLTPLWFMCSPSLAKSHSSIQLFGSTDVTLNVFAIQSCLPFNAPIRRNDTSLRLSMPLRVILS
jgi:hypothetical protein